MSSVIAQLAYDPASRRLAVTFTTGRRYAYRDVPEDVAQDFATAPSQGEYFNAVIRDRYPFDRLR